MDILSVEIFECLFAYPQSILCHCLALPLLGAAIAWLELVIVFYKREYTGHPLRFGVLIFPQQD
jgi:hypothetical protein